MIALYARVSTQEQAANGHSIAEQKERLEAFCTAHGWSDFQHYTDAGFSGGTTNRPALTDLIRDTEQGKVQRIIVYKLDRLSRSQKDTLHLIEDIFLRNGADFVSVSENFDTGTAFGKAIIGMLAVFAQLEREQIKERMNLGRTARTKEGKFHGSGMIPIGYDYKDGKLIVNDYEAELVRTVYQKAAAGVPIRRIVEDMNAAGLTHKHGQWNATTLRKVLSRRTYIGQVSFGGTWYSGQHEPIIDSALFQTVQAINASRKEKALSENVRLGRASSLLAGLVFCARCGARYTSQVYTHGSYRYERYSCASRSKRNKELIKDTACKNDSYDRTALENAVFGEIRRLRFERDKICDEKPRTAGNTRIARLTRIDDSIRRLVDLYAAGSVQLPVIREKIEALTAEKKKLLQEQEPQITKSQAVGIAETLDNVLAAGSFDEKRYILTTLIDRIEIDGQDITIRWTFAT